MRPGFEAYPEGAAEFAALHTLAQLILPTALRDSFIILIKNKENRDRV